MKGDKQLKAERGYRGKSYVRPDGSEVLLDKQDWNLRKQELWTRCGGRCEKIVIEFQQVIRFGRVCHDSSAERCKNEAQDPHHIIPRSKGRDDRLSNLQALCRYHHSLVDPRKTRFGDHQPMKKRREQ